MENCPFPSVFPFGFKSSDILILGFQQLRLFCINDARNSPELGPWNPTDLNSAATNRLCDLGVSGLTSEPVV